MKYHSEKTVRGVVTSYCNALRTAVCLAKVTNVGGASIERDIARQNYTLPVSARARALMMDLHPSRWPRVQFAKRFWDGPR